MTINLFSSRCQSRQKKVDGTTTRKTPAKSTTKCATKPPDKCLHKRNAKKMNPPQMEHCAKESLICNTYFMPLSPSLSSNPCWNQTTPNTLCMSQIYQALPPTTSMPDQPYAPYSQPKWGSSTTLIGSPSYPKSPPPSYDTMSPTASPMCSDDLRAIQSPHQDTSRHCRATTMMNQGAALCDRISSRMCAVLTAIDGQEFDGDEKELDTYHDIPPLAETSHSIELTPPRTYFSKVWLYSNSRLPPHLPPFKVYISTYPLLCLAAQYSLRVYDRLSNASPISTNPLTPATAQPHYVPASLRLGTKAMVLTLHPCDSTNTLVLAVRGTQTFMDWAVNFRPAPSSPANFLDDPGNAVHGGFLAVARAMLAPAARELRRLIREVPARRAASLLVTGHSAGGAVASLLYMHMVSQDHAAVQSELKELGGCFKRVHCVTFGAPPVSLLPLQKPAGKALEKSVFFAFANEGDPVVRADKAFVGSLVRLYACPAPESVMGQRPPRWEVPEASLSCAGRLVLLRTVAVKGKDKKRGGEVVRERVEACLTSDEQLRGVVFGSPLMHMMKVYARRIEALAMGAVTAGIYGV